PPPGDGQARVLQPLCKLLGLSVMRKRHEDVEGEVTRVRGLAALALDELVVFSALVGGTLRHWCIGRLPRVLGFVPARDRDLGVPALSGDEVLDHAFDASRLPRVVRVYEVRRV